MSNQLKRQKFLLEPQDNERLANLCGPFDENLKQIEARVGVEVTYRGNEFGVTGKATACLAAIDIIKALYVDTQAVKGQLGEVSPEDVHLSIQQARNLEQEVEGAPVDKHLFIKTKRGVVKPRNENQTKYVGNILTHDITFGVGPAGTGKTYLAVACAVDALERQEIRRILLTR
ncbi:MAG: PhoH family protein, partial [Psychrosphaera sp.]|nr:PhoH family protein [Psychrosphaera sp.]